MAWPVQVGDRRTFNISIRCRDTELWALHAEVDVDPGSHVAARILTQVAAMRYVLDRSRLLSMVNLICDLVAVDISTKLTGLDESEGVDQKVHSRR
jgi:hypothetical protein